MIFNRPELTLRTFASIREAQPSQLFVAADGPRADHPEDVEKCAATRAVVDQVDWSCEVQTLFRDQNLGCKMAVSSAIDWFFEHVEEGVILEDDCIPVQSFYQFTSEMLERYRDDDRVLTVSGNNHQDGRKRGEASYYWSGFVHIWGWATWRRAWSDYDVRMTDWPSFRDSGGLKQWWSDEVTIQYWQRIFDRVYAGEIDTWDYQFQFQAWRTNRLSAIPQVNLVTNTGFGVDATHTKNAHQPSSTATTEEMVFPLTAPAEFKRDLEADIYTQNHLFNPPKEKPGLRSFFRRVRLKLRKELS